MNTFDKPYEKNKHYLMLCELHYPPFHGKTEDSNPYIETHYLVNDRFEPKTGISYSCLDEHEEYDTDNEYNSDDEDINQNSLIKLNDSIQFLKKHYSSISNYNPNYFKKHPTIRNYHNIISSPNYFKPEIGEYIILPTQEAIAILKTFWLRIIQRKWKKVFAERQNIIKQRCYISSLNELEIYGKWPQTCNNLPGLKGMLKNLN